jgi:CubicO group peptidase (beta-lactamase class C family)
MAPAIPPRTYPFGGPGAFGEPGAGGSFAFADPEAEVGYAYVTNRMGAKQGGDPRDLALREALHWATGQVTASTVGAHPLEPLIHRQS